MCFASNAQRLRAMISLKSSPRSSFALQLVAARSSGSGSVPRAACDRGWSMVDASIQMIPAARCRTSFASAMSWSLDVSVVGMPMSNTSLPFQIAMPA